MTAAESILKSSPLSSRAVPDPYQAATNANPPRSRPMTANAVQFAVFRDPSPSPPQSPFISPVSHNPRPADELQAIVR